MDALLYIPTSLWRQKYAISVTKTSNFPSSEIPLFTVDLIMHSHGTTFLHLTIVPKTERVNLNLHTERRVLNNEINLLVMVLCRTDFSAVTFNTVFRITKSLRKCPYHVTLRRNIASNC